MAHTAVVPPSRPISPARRRGQDAAPYRRNDLDRVEHRHTINTGGTAAKPTTNIKINNSSYTEKLTSSRGAEPTSGPDKPALLVGEAYLVSGSTRDVDAQAKRHYELPSDD